MNTIMLLDIETTDFKNSDFNKVDLIHLLLIYINYPNIFRKIYNTETQGKRGYFSAINEFDDDFPKQSKRETGASYTEAVFENSIKYTKYIKDLTNEQRFLLNKVFNIKTRFKDNTRIDNISEKIKKSYACFNGGTFTNSGSNLEQYLDLIISQTKPAEESQFQSYLNDIDKLKGGTSMEDILKQPKYAVDKGESNLEHLWSAILNSLYEFNNLAGKNLIIYILNNIQYYSFFSNDKKGVGFRDDLSPYLVKTLDTVGWVDQNGEHRRNDNENIKEIAEWVFGEKRHQSEGVIQVLSMENRGVLGIYDLLAFRLFCSADRGGDIFNVSRAIAFHANPKAPTEGSTKDIAVAEMREISQKIIQIFKKNYIDKNINILKQIEALTLSDLTGRYHDYVQEKITSKEIDDVDTAIARHKTKLKAFITYQLGSPQISLGVGCGYYDLEGNNDKQGINKFISSYLFDICFNPKLEQENYIIFIDYLLINFANIFSRNGRDYAPRISEFTKVLDKDMLAKYWTENHTTIKSLNLTQQDKKIHQSSYIANYNTHLQEVFDELDKLLIPLDEKKPIKQENK